MAGEEKARMPEPRDRLGVGKPVPHLHPQRQVLVDQYAPLVATALQATGIDAPLDVVKARLASPKATLVLPDPSDLRHVATGQLAAASVETTETETTEQVTSARDFSAVRPLRVSVEVSAVPEEVRRAVTR